MIARMKLNARLFDLPCEKRPKSKRGPIPPKGKRLLCMKKRVTDKRIKWTSMLFSEWYGQKKKEMLVTSGIAIWHKSNTIMVKVKWVLIKDPDGKLDPVLLTCSDVDLSVYNIVSFFVRRWRVEVTFAEVRRHLGVESQRQWSDLAIERSTPCLMALFSIVCLMANTLHVRQNIQPNAAAWYPKIHVTFSDVLAAVRIEIFTEIKLSTTTYKDLIEDLKHKIRYLGFLFTQTAA